jgi:hypothetical protein
MKRIVPPLRVSFFFILIALSCLSCRQADEKPAVSIVSKNDKAVAVIIRNTNLGETELSTRLKIRLVKSGERTTLLGEFSRQKDDVIFEPLVPFTKGLRYEVLLDDTLLTEIEIPFGDVVPPRLLAIYPSQDTVPENLLKMYFEFSEPMVEGSSLMHLTLIRNDQDTMRATFLDLQPELWNTEGTVLTLWLDPGRIKRDLIPNKELGTPLMAGYRYTLYVANTWRSKNNVELLETYTKTFVTTTRDDLSPKTTDWKIFPPAVDTKNALEIQFPQPLDYFLLREAVSIKTSDERVPGNIEVSGEERIFRFIPDNPWAKGHFKVQVEGRLEDLSGNNLNRPFDRIVDDQGKAQEQEFFQREFDVVN